MPRGRTHWTQLFAALLGWIGAWALRSSLQRSSSFPKPWSESCLGLLLFRTGLVAASFVFGFPCSIMTNIAVAHRVQSTLPRVKQKLGSVLETSLLISQSRYFCITGIMQPV